MRAERIGSVVDARRAARRRVPRVVFDYIDGAADDERTMRANEAAFGDLVFVPRMATGRTASELGTTVLGSPVRLPVLLAPCGLVRLMHPDGARGVARAARRAGTVSVLSTVAGSPLEEVVPASPGGVWFQLYAARGREDAAPLVERAASAGVEVLVVTVDTPALGNRERDRRNGVSTPLRLGPSSAARLGPQVLARPVWAYRMARDGVRFLPSRPGPTARPGFDLLSMVASPFSWDDVSWLRERWRGKLVVKGLLSGSDAREAVARGADAVIVSNHGGRQLDGAPPTLHVLPEVVEAAAPAEVLLDGGIRRGTDVAKALALGARAVLVGRPYLYGLAACGEEGVLRVLEVLRAELARALVLLGCPSVRELDASYVAPRGFRGLSASPATR